VTPAFFGARRYDRAKQQKVTIIVILEKGGEFFSELSDASANAIRLRWSPTFAEATAGKLVDDAAGWSH
jgi:hypothetical protein